MSKKYLFTKVAAFLLVIAPVFMEARRCLLVFGEPKLPKE